jgi:cell division septum initiation protein DivIVA
MGNFYSLKEKYKVLVVTVGSPKPKYSDIHVSEAKGLAEAIVKSGYSIVLDLKHCTMLEQYKFLADLLEELYSVEKEKMKPLVLIIDEIHRISPERSFIKLKDVSQLQNEVTYWISEFSRTGRNYGVGYVVAGQREAETAKTTLTQCGVTIYFRLMGIDYTNFAKKVSHESAKRAKQLGKGEAVVVGLEFDEFFVKIGERKTTHRGATPDLKPIEPKSVEDFVKLLKIRADKKEEEKKKKKAEDAELQVEIKKLRKERDNLENQLHNKMKELASLNEKIVGYETTINVLQEENDALKKEIENLENRIKELEEQLSQASEIERDIERVREAAQNMADSVIELSDALGLDLIPQDVVDLKKKLSEVEEELQIYRNTERELKIRVEETLTNTAIQNQVDMMKRQLRELKRRSGAFPQVMKMAVLFDPESVFFPEDFDVGVTDGTVRQYLKELVSKKILTEEVVGGRVGFKNVLHLYVTERIRRIKPTAPDEAISKILNDLVKFIME